MLNKKNMLVLLLFPFFAFKCNKKEDKCLHGKIIRISCASFVVQVLNKDSVGSYGWKDVGGHGVYNNVFTIMNSCKIGKWSRGEEMYFDILDSLVTDDCVKCKMYDAPPQRSLMVKNVTRKKCE